MLGERGYANSNRLAVAGGTLLLHGGKFIAAGLTLSSHSSAIDGFGTIADSIDNEGRINVQDGTLVITGAVGEAGHLHIGTFSQLELGAGTAEALTFGSVSAHRNSNSTRRQILRARYTAWQPRMSSISRV